MKNTKTKILEKIKKNEVKMKPKWWWVAREEAKLSLVIIGLLGASLLAGSTAYWWELSQGDIKKAGILPVLLAGGIIILTGLVLGLMGRIGDNYKKGLEKLGLITALLLIVISVVIWVLIHQYELELLFKLI